LILASVATAPKRKLKQEEQKKVVILIPVLLRGGTEAQTLHLARALAADGYAVSMCCYYEADSVVVAGFKAAGARVERLVPGQSAASVRGLRLAHLGWLLWRYLRRVRPRVVHVQYMAPGLVPIVAARLAGVRRVMATVHQPGTVYGGRARLLLRVASRLCTAFSCVSRAVEESWFGESAVFDATDVGKRRHFTLYNCVDVERFAECASQVDRQATRHELRHGSGPIVGVVGRLRREKGHVFLLDAFRAVTLSVPEAMLLVVGDGPDREGLRAQARSLAVDDRVVWWGERRSEELPRLYAAMDLVVIPSLFEGFGLVALEAMAAGRPVVASATGGLMEIIVDGVTGVLVPAGDRDALARAMVSMLSNPRKAAAMGDEGRKAARERFPESAFRSAILSAYASYVG